jgi:hypothetical protein
MRLDHVSYVASHDQISDVVNRIGSQIGTAFVDGGIHPKFGTRNFTAPLLNGQYIEIVCPLDHPATDVTPFGSAVRNKLEDGGGWLFWVLATSDMHKEETRLNRNAVPGQRMKPDGTLIQWVQIGILDSIQDPHLPYIIKWENSQHPSKDGKPKAKINEIEINLPSNFGRKNNLNWIENTLSSPKLKLIFEETTPGIASVSFLVDNDIVVIS